MRMPHALSTLRCVKKCKAHRNCPRDGLRPTSYNWLTGSASPELYEYMERSVGRCTFKKRDPFGGTGKDLMSHAHHTVWALVTPKGKVLSWMVVETTMDKNPARVYIYAIISYTPKFGTRLIDEWMRYITRRSFKLGKFIRIVADCHSKSGQRLFGHHLGFTPDEEMHTHYSTVVPRTYPRNLRKTT